MTASDAATRLWSLIERIPRTEMAEDIMTGFVASVLCQKDGTIRRELHSHNVVSRSQLFRILNGISHKRRHETSDGYEGDSKKPRYTENRFSGSCHRCGVAGHKSMDCRKRQVDSSTQVKTLKQPSASKSQDRSRITCYVCGQPGHVASSCPDRKGGGGTVNAVVKEVNTCGLKSARSNLTTSSGELVSFLFDSGSACSLLSFSLLDKFPGTKRYDLVFLTGIGKENVKCESQVKL